MFRSLLRDYKLLLLLFLALLIKILSFQKAWVERYYTYGFYPYISKVLRILFGWIPFSIGDLFYLCLICFLLYKAIRFGIFLKRRKEKKFLIRVVVKQILHFALYVYLAFNILWGLNYDRQGIATQLQLDVQPYSVEDLRLLTSVLQERVNNYATGVDSLKRVELNKSRNLFRAAVASYQQVNGKYPFLAYEGPSIKASFFSNIGHYFGFTGYYNPFSGEAQLKTTIPFFLKPFVVTHEIAHQLGYGKENEANFVAFLVGRQASNIEIRYSIYFEMYLYAFSDLSRKDTAAARKFRETLHPQVKRDLEAFSNYLYRTRNIIEPVVSSFYDQFLKWNSQPKGKKTYNEVVTWLIAYGKKYGLNAI
ncbi:DUF3810 domain-containing protein [Chitinophagaceae bacterium LB-8]|uniref:DUF3810 domain-containing protein n=1 Tax=Paraflavisolibacter caeni TaxID=2982496 RepID=A0A9X2XNQ7_9BACT|nr:DUF3810 domain-containing protein [Paraflavisolibacter caeni]MCU7548864.1 DUF3810 domain-containing protein [Paraflavisolibacter caeni]